MSRHLPAAIHDHKIAEHSANYQAESDLQSKSLLLLWLRDELLVNSH